MDFLRDLVNAFVERGGYWPDTLDPLIENSPEFVQAYVEFAGFPLRPTTLEPKAKALISLALSASVTHLHAPSVRQHIRRALQLGSSKEELIEVLQLISVIGVHACVIGMPALIEKAASNPDIAISIDHSDTERKNIKRDFVTKRGYWSQIWDGLLALDPAYFKSFTEFSAVPWIHGTLDPKIKEFVYIAVDISVTHQYIQGTYVHIEKALKHGATPTEILEVMQLASIIGLHSFEVALPILEEELNLFRIEASSTDEQPRKRR